LATGDLGACELGEKPSDAFEWRVIVILGIDGQQFDQDIVFHLAAAGVADAVCEGTAALTMSVSILYTVGWRLLYIYRDANASLADLGSRHLDG
jgi:hypothetical protein